VRCGILLHPTFAVLAAAAEHAGREDAVPVSVAVAVVAVILLDGSVYPPDAAVLDR